jgi:hypothetical protein
MNKHILFFLALYVTNILSAQCIEGNCANGKGKILLPNGAFYKGQFKDGVFNGKGLIVYSDGNQYDGQWENRLPNGYGVLSYSDGIIRKGFWKNGIPILTDGNIDLAAYTKYKMEPISGCVYGDCQNGTGAYYFTNGTVYKGTFKNGKILGTGKLTYFDGTNYTGELRSGLPNGNGIMAYNDGSRQKGNWIDGEFTPEEFSTKGNSGCINGDCNNGKGVFVFNVGKYPVRYEGDMRDGTPYGFGTASYTNGEKYIGEWLEGKHNGAGTLILPNGLKIEGEWKDGLYTGKSNYDNKTDTLFVKYEPYDVATYSPKNNGFINADSLIKVREKNKSQTYAVIIGISSYTHMPALKYADDDAWKMYGFFKSKKGGSIADFNIKMLIDDQATKANIIESIQEVFLKATKNDQVYLYFSGHGLEDAFLPIDFDGYKNKVFHKEINDILSQCNAKTKICFSDACFSGNLSALNTDENYLQTQYQGFAKSGTTLILSSNTRENALESSTLRQGVFSHFLLRGLDGESDNNEDKVITVQEIFDFIKTKVVDYTDNKQTPVLKGNFDPATVIAIRRK